MIYKGLGEYQCEDCENLEYDDYGKVRNYIEKFPGASIAQVAEASHVSRKSINEMLRDCRFEITGDSKTFLKCEVCGKNIRYGRMCPECEKEYHRRVEAQTRNEHQFNGSLVGNELGEEGKIRFRRERQGKDD